MTVVAPATAEPVTPAAAEPVTPAAAEPVTPAAAEPEPPAAAEPVAPAAADPVIPAATEPTVVGLLHQPRLGDVYRQPGAMIEGARGLGGPEPGNAQQQGGDGGKQDRAFHGSCLRFIASVKSAANVPYGG